MVAITWRNTNTTRQLRPGPRNWANTDPKVVRITESAATQVHHHGLSRDGVRGYACCTPTNLLPVTKAHHFSYHGSELRDGSTGSAYESTIQNLLTQEYANPRIYLRIKYQQRHAAVRCRMHSTDSCTTQTADDQTLLENTLSCWTCPPSGNECPVVHRPLKCVFAHLL